MQRAFRSFCGVYRKCRRVQMVSTLLKLLNISAVHIKSAECRQNGKSRFYGFYITKFKYHLCYYLNLFAILAKGTVR